MDGITDYTAGHWYENLLRPAEVAQLMRVDARTIAEWATKGKLAYVRTPSGHRRYPEVCVRAAMRGDIRIARTLPDQLRGDPTLAFGMTLDDEDETGASTA